MKTAVASSIAATFILLISFQNCQKPPHPDEINGQPIRAVASSSKIDLNQEAVLSVNFVVQDTKVITKAGNSYQINYNKILQIDLKTGIISESSDLSSEILTYCLTEALRNELVSILKSSQVCKLQQNLPAGTVCSQVMKMAYAQVFTTREHYDLGAASDGCGSNSMDLCDNQSSLLKGYIEAVKKQYQQLACPL